jgi:predicted adenylyl cyclase CyaB
VHRNVELKAADRDPAATLARCDAAGARDSGVLHQRDTYFAAPLGRLKLREDPTRPGPAVLVAYQRADRAEARSSAYHLVDVADPAVLREALTDTLGVVRVVEKERHLFLWEETVRIHLDTVAGLGAFVEIEAVAAAGSDLAREHDQVARLQALLGIDAGDVLEASYLEL